LTEAVDALERARGRAMGARLVREARALGVDPDALSRILIAHDLAMAVRDRAVPDDHDPDYLHPGRSALVAMTDGGVLDARTLETVIVFDSLRGDLAPADESVRAACGAEIVAVRAALPRGSMSPGQIKEVLLDLDGPVAIGVLAEALDHARHAHLGEDPVVMGEVLSQVERAYHPVAGRVSPPLAARFEHWGRHFRKRLL
jgi:hypothetical protein